tara:strand:- start:302 stop:2020 length:1719 start_codon:yes stop_codon:yes gene_type:complete
MSLSCWCGFSTSNFIHDCAVCSIVARGITGWPNWEIPDDSELQQTNAILNSGRGLTPEQRLLMLAESQTIDANLPRAFRSQRGQRQAWSQYASNLWKELASKISMHGNIGNLRLPLPGTGFITIHGEKGVIFIDEIRLTGPLPLLDIAIWLSCPDRVRLVSDWKLFLLAMSCCTRECTPGAIENWSEWFRHSTWQGVEPHMILQDGFTPESLRHPYLKWIGLIEDQIFPDRNRRELVDGNLNIILDQGGITGEKWGEIVSGPANGRSSILQQTTVPKLVVVNNRFCLLALNRGKPSAIPLVVDPRVWRLLISWTFSPPNTTEAKLLNGLFWSWNSQNEIWLPDVSERRSIQFLKDTVVALEDCSSLIPEKTDGKNALRINALSGLTYLITPTASAMKYTVRAIPHESMISDIDERGLSICIDSEASNSLPAGDVVVSYLLSLRNDVVSQNQIFTIGHLLVLLEMYPNWQQKIHGNQNWWDELVESYNPEEADEGLLEEEEDEYWEEEEIQYENPPDHIFEEIEQRHNHRFRQIILQQLNALPNDERRERFREAVETLFVRFGGDVADLEEAE